MCVCVCACVCVCVYKRWNEIEYYSAIQKKEILPFAIIWMELKGVMISETNQIKKDKYSMISLLCGI